ncbi:MAG TPA: dTDP-4-dehydrorhamnose reductase [Thermomicrobiales bacterium]|nr:dTDP-4-dehydrorhamnose reductase [Thermomicrobiales bacterium]
MKTVVIGASGQLGHDLLRRFGDDAIGLTHQDLDVTDGLSVAEMMRSHKPDWVVNTAAFHRVDDCEMNPTLSFAVNATGAANVARAAADIGAGVVFYSTDYVFGGEGRVRGAPHRESDAPDPLNVYGVSKWAGERLVAQRNPRHLVIRSAGLYGTATSRKGWTFPELMVNKARSEGKLKVVTDQALSPTFTHDLAETTAALMAAEATGLFHLTNAGECSWWEFAKATVDLAGIPVEVEPTVSTQQPRRAKRPPYSAMASERVAAAGVAPMRPWPDALAAYLRAKGFMA